MADEAKLYSDNDAFITAEHIRAWSMTATISGRAQNIMLKAASTIDKLESDLAAAREQARTAEAIRLTVCGQCDAALRYAACFKEQVAEYRSALGQLRFVVDSRRAQVIEELLAKQAPPIQEAETGGDASARQECARLRDHLVLALEKARTAENRADDEHHEVLVRGNDLCTLREQLAARDAEVAQRDEELGRMTDAYAVLVEATRGTPAERRASEILAGTSPTPTQDEVGETVAAMVNETLEPLPAPTQDRSGRESGHCGGSDCDVPGGCACACTTCLPTLNALLPKPAPKPPEGPNPKCTHPVPAGERCAPCDREWVAIRRMGEVRPGPAPGAEAKHAYWCRTNCGSLAQGIRCGLHEHHECTCKRPAPISPPPDAKAAPEAIQLYRVLSGAWMVPCVDTSRGLDGTVMPVTFIRQDIHTAAIARAEALEKALRDLVESAPKYSDFPNPMAARRAVSLLCQLDPARTGPEVGR